MKKDQKPQNKGRSSEHKKADSDSGASQTTTDHNKIMEWAEKRGGKPSIVKGTESGKGSGILRFDFGEKEEGLEEISWEEFFQVFDERDLAMLYQEETADGKISRFFKFINK